MSFRITEWGGVAALIGVALSSLACASSESLPGDESSGSGGSGAGGTGSTASSNGFAGSGDDASVGSTGSSQASSGSGGGPLGTYGPNDMPPFTSGAELCAYVNEEREGYAAHERYRGPPWSGEYHQEVTW